MHTHTHTHRISFTVVSDPENVEDDCVEVGNAELDLRAVSAGAGLQSCLTL